MLHPEEMPGCIGHRQHVHCCRGAQPGHRLATIPVDGHGRGLGFLQSATNANAALAMDHMVHVLSRLLPGDIASAVMGDSNSLMDGEPGAQFDEDQINTDAHFSQHDVEYLLAIRNSGACGGEDGGMYCRNKIDQLIAAAKNLT